MFAEKPARGAILFRAPPVGERVKIGPGVGDSSHMEDLLEEGKRLRRTGAREMRELGGVMGYDRNGGRKGTILALGGIEENGKTLLRGKLEKIKTLVGKR